MGKQAALKYRDRTTTDHSISEDLYKKLDEAASIGIFRQNKKAVVRWCKSQPDILDEIIFRGIVFLVGQAAQRAKYGPKGLLSKRAKTRRCAASRTAKAQMLDRIVELLDHMQVGEKMLGDCTSRDLLRAAVESDNDAKEATLQGTFYRQLAAMLEPNDTVRTAAGRGKIVALLTTTFKEQE
jgi:hypothetical protein